MIKYAALLGLLVQTVGGAGIHGVVEYADRHFAAGVTVLARNIDSGERFETRTGMNGTFQFLELPLGTYHVSVEVERFRPFVRELVVNTPGWSEAVDVHLEFVTAETVMAVPAIFETASDASVGARFSRDELNAGPLTIGRMPQPPVNLGTLVIDSVDDLGQFTCTRPRRYAHRFTIPASPGTGR